MRISSSENSIEKLNTRISSRDLSAYIGQGPATSPVTYPPSIMTPYAGDPQKYGDVANEVTCNKCDVKLIKTEDPETGKETVICPECGSRYSSKDFHRDYTSYSMTPGTLDYNNGANVNNEAQGINYHDPVQMDVASQRWGK
jgi:DNA-directed RNA polymerase subunit RPC12/RpoP